MRRRIDGWTIILAAVLFIAADCFVALLRNCQPAEQHYEQYCAEKYYGLLDTIVYRLFASGVDWIGLHHDLVLAAATIVIAWFTIVLARLGRRQIKDSRILHRAYIRVDPRGLEITPKKVYGHIAFVNVGHLPAQEFQNNVFIQWSDMRDLEQFDERAIEPTKMILPIGAEAPRRTDALIEQDRMAVEIGEGFVYVWGEVAYKDGFENPRWLKFCHRYRCEAGKDVASGWIAKGYARLHHHHNDGD